MPCDKTLIFFNIILKKHLIEHKNPPPYFKENTEGDTKFGNLLQ